MSKKILIMAGGTGGHIFPALAIATELKKRTIDAEWLGTTKGMENIIVPQNNIKLHSIAAVGLRGKNIISLIKTPFFLLYATIQTIHLFVKIKPDVALSMGGFVAGIGGLVAWIFKIPLVIHEQNAIAGTTNKLLNKIATKTFQAFNGTFANDAITCGNPISFTAKQKHPINKKLNLLIIGGSLGSKPINEIVTKLKLDINIWHQTGKIHFNSVKSQYKDKTIKVEAFINDMAGAYAWADIVLCRAGAMTISELMLSANASILVPLPHATDNHQLYNAKILTNNGAGILINQKDLSVELLNKTLLNIDKTQIQSMSNKALKLASPKATQDISDYLQTL